MKRSLEIWLRDFQKKKISFFLAPLSWIYGSGVHLRHRLYDQKWLKQNISRVCVVSVGNLVAGGAGKTQVVDLIVSKLVPSLRVAILSRGYRSQVENKLPLLVDPLTTTPESCGDEPWLLASRWKDAQVIVCKDRFLAAKEGEKLQKQVLVLDDGMQHRHLRRDFEIVVIDGSDPFGRGRYLPWGMLRDTPKRLKCADLLVTIGKLAEKDREKLSKLTEAPIVQAEIKVNGVKALNGSSMGSIKGKKVAVFCGIGNPERFLETVKKLGVQVVACHFFSDHQKIETEELLSFARYSKSQGASLMVCTEKDKVKLKTGQEEKECPIGWVSVNLSIEDNGGEFENIIHEIKHLAGAI